MRAAAAFALMLWAFPQIALAQPTCFTSSLPQLAPVKTGNPDRACQVLAKVLESAPGPETAWIPGQIVDSTLKLTQGAFAKDTFVLAFRVTHEFSTTFTTGSDELVRLSSTDAGARTGSWWVPKEFVTDATGRWLSVEAIAELLALPPQADLKIVAYSGAIATGTFGYVGIAAPAFNHQGGGIQFWFPTEPVYTKAVAPPIGTAK